MKWSKKDDEFYGFEESVDQLDDIFGQRWNEKLKNQIQRKVW